jgi:valyl-tRNA synthetase
MNVDRAAEIGITVDPSALGGMPAATDDAPLEARWIVAEFHKTTAEVNQSLANYRYDDAANTIYQFFWGSFCDWYLEIVKLRLDFSETADKAATQAALTTLLSVFEASLRLLSPFMPFLTEEIWHAVYEDVPPVKSIALTRYPLIEKDRSEELHGHAILMGTYAHMSHLQNLIGIVRNQRKESNVPEKELVQIAVHVFGANAVVKASFTENEEIIRRLARVSAIKYSESELQEPGVVRHFSYFEVKIDYERTIDIPAERERLTKEIAKLEKGLASAEKQLGNEGFLAKAPSNIVEGLKKQEAENRQLLAKASAALAALPLS